MNNDQIIESAIIIALKEKPILSAGDICAFRDDPITYKFLWYKEQEAIVEDFNGITRGFPANEVFDVNLVKKIAIQIQFNLAIPSQN